MVRPSNTFWIAVATAAVAHNIWAAITGHEQLSEAVDRYRVTAPLITDVVIIVTAAHLARRLPRWADPLTWLFIGLTHHNGARVKMS